MPYSSLNSHASFDLPTDGALLPSLRQQPAGANIRAYSSPVQPPATGLPLITTTTSATSAPKSPIFSDLFSIFPDPFSRDLRSPPTTAVPQDAFSPWKLSGGPDTSLTQELPGDPTAVAKRVPNITWRMTTLALQKKKREENERNTVDVPGSPTEPPVPDTVVVEQELPSVPPRDLGETERGRRIGKGKIAKVSAVGFDADSVDKPWYVCASKTLFLVGTDLIFHQGC